MGILESVEPVNSPSRGIISEKMVPGQMAFTRMPLGASSTPLLLVSEMVAALDAA